MKNKRYDEISHKEITTIEDINKIVENEIDLDKKRNSKMKEGVATAAAMSIVSKIIIIVMSLVMAAVIVYVSLLVYFHFTGSHLNNSTMLEHIKEISK